MTKWIFFFRLKTKNLIKKKSVEVIRTHKPGNTEYHTLLLSLERILCRKRGWQAIYLTWIGTIFFGPFFQIRGPLSQQRTWGFRSRWHLWGPQALDNYSIEKENKFFLDHFFSNSRSIISGTDQRISVPMTFMRSPGLRQFFYRKRKLFFLDHFFSNSRSIISGTDLRISVPMTFMRSPGLRQFFYRKRKLIFFGPFFSNSRSIISGTDLRISVPMTFMRSPGLRQFFYRKRKLIFFGPFFFKFPVHYLRDGPEDFGSDDIYEVPRP